MKKSGYPESLQETLAKVEETRSERLKEAKKQKYFPKLSPDEYRGVLEKYHPDYKPEGRKPLQVGPNKGDLLQPELIEVLQGRPWIEPATFASRLKSPDFSTDVLIIGGGGAGSAAAILATEQGADVIMATKLRHGDANTVMAEGGIQAADLPYDSPYFHFLDTIGGGHFTNDKKLVRALVTDGPLVMKWLEDLGAMFDKEPDGTMKELKGGGLCRRRMHSSADMTGSEIMRVLRDEVRNREDKIRILEFCAAVELLLDESGAIGGAVLYNLDTEEFIVVQAKAVILATGGSGRLHLHGYATTNHYGATGDGLALAYRLGVPLRNLKYAQFHPTGAVYPEQCVGMLITEKVRTLGGEPVNYNGERFCYPLEPRDVEAALFIRECLERGNGIVTPTGRVGIWLDSPMIDMLHGEGTVAKALAGKYLQFKRYGIDIAKEPMLIFPTLHYQNGGLEINEYGETRIPGLFAAGEVSGGVHGDNRLMGNSLLDTNVFGRRAGAKAAQFATQRKEVKSLTLKHIENYLKELKQAGVEPEMKSPVVLPDYRNPKIVQN
ncbi:FAD-binding protein [Desulfohalobiaceae bacterium Ax17]|uniref:FAD-binding protein n=1 Tax=Desulfovulcanus ferrireducens TaxID=2831190 RepID=UPI00207BBA7B|nr:FAD-binding protein [Desulfovulcanus ferrireducens]MBT8764032.1 FAD-binding protein [Desulfovulcanus ferrireducens]